MKFSFLEGRIVFYHSERSEESHEILRYAEVGFLREILRLHSGRLPGGSRFSTIMTCLPCLPAGRAKNGNFNQNAI